MTSNKECKARRDDCFSFNTIVNTPNGDIKIGLLQDNDTIFSYNGKSLVVSKVKDYRMTGVKRVFEVELEDGTKIEASLGHPFLTQRGYVLLKDLTCDDFIVKVDSCKLNTTELNGLRSHQDITNQQSEENIDRIGYTDIFTKKHTANLIQNFMFITKTITRTITNYLILKCYQVVNTPFYMEKKPQQEEVEHRNKSRNESSWQDKQRKENISELQSKELYKKETSTKYVDGAKLSLLSKIPIETILGGVVENVQIKTQKTSWLKKRVEFIQGLSAKVVKFVAKNLLKLVVTKDFAQLNVEKSLQEEVVLRSLRHTAMFAKNVESNLKLLELKEDFAKINVGGSSVTKERLKLVKGITYKGIKPTYNFEVEELHNFLVEGGVVTHNCIDCLSNLTQMSMIAPGKNETSAFIHDKGVFEEDPMSMAKDSCLF